MKKSSAVIRAHKHNLADVLAHGPRLSYNRRTAVAATCRKRGTMLLTGLGGMGVGTMWVAADRRRRKVPNFATERAGSLWYYRTYWGLK